MSARRQTGLLWAAAALALVLAAPLAAAFAPGLPECFFKSTFGVPCPTCGGTRAVVALARLHGALAFRSNPLVTLGLISFVLGGLVAGSLAVLGRGLREPARYPVWLRVSLVCLIAANWAWLVADGR
jgi:ascorbate-specific PTS system EIIC-type component UlaA